MKFRLACVLLLMFTSSACTSEPPPAAAPVPSKLAGMWSDPPSSSIGLLCFIACTDAGIERLNALLDDPANDKRPYMELRADAETHAK